MPRFKSKPREVDAYRATHGFNIHNPGRADPITGKVENETWKMEPIAVDPGDWVVTEQNGHKYRMEDGEFRKTFEATGDQDAIDEINKEM